MQKLVWQNSSGEEINLTSGNYGITNWEGFSNTSLNIQSQQVPFQDGGVFLDALMEQRELTVTLAMQDNGNLEERYRMRRELIHALNPKLGEGYLIYTNDFTSKRIKCVPQIPLFETHNSNDSGTPKAGLSWTACNPYWEDLEEKSVIINLGDSQFVNNDGDIPCKVKIEMFPQTSVVKPQIKNITNDKKIIYNNNLSKNLIIDTNVGEKTVYEEELKLKLNKYLENIEKVFYIESKLLYVAKSGNIILYSRNGEEWEFVDTKAEKNLSYLEYSDAEDLFIAVGEDGYAMKSSDLINWEDNITTGTIYDFEGLAYSKEEHIFIAITQHEILKTTDGNDWEIVESGYVYPNTLLSCQYIENLNTFIIFNESSDSLTSSDGDTWELHTDTNINGSVTSICYSEELNCYFGNNDGLVTSSDCIYWTRVNNQTNGITHIIYSEYLKLLIVTSNNGIFTSEDGGENFTEITDIPDINYYYICEVVSLNKFIATGETGTILSSYNATDWVVCQGGKDDSLRVINSVAFSDTLNLFVAVGTYRTSLISKDGVRWTYKEINVAMNEVIWIKELNCFMGVGGRFVAKSIDGYNWSYVDTDYEGSSRQLYSITYSAEKKLFVAVGMESSGRCIITSEDGINWTRRNPAVPNFGLFKVIYAEFIHKFIAVGYIFITSENGIDWTTAIASTNLSLRGIAVSEQLKRIVIVGYDDFIVGKDGVVWEHIYNGERFESVAYSESFNMFLAIGSDEYQNGYFILTSYNGDNWTKIYNSSYTKSATYGKNKFILIGGYETIFQYSYELKDLENKIAELSKDSDMGLDLTIGRNELQILKDSGNFICRVSFRQKYIGV